MRELSLHILDVAENSLKAGADRLEIQVTEDRKGNRLSFSVRDNGKGVPQEWIHRLTDPFFSGWMQHKRIGLGLSLLEGAARRCGGEVSVKSEIKSGTRITATFMYDHIDRAPLGDLAGTLSVLLAGNPGVDIVFSWTADGKEMIVDTAELKKEIGPRSVSAPAAVMEIRRKLEVWRKSVSP